MGWKEILKEEKKFILRLENGGDLMTGKISNVSDRFKKEFDEVSNGGNIQERQNMYLFIIDEDADIEKVEEFIRDSGFTYNFVSY